MTIGVAMLAPELFGGGVLGAAPAFAQGGFVDPPAADATDPYVVAQAAELGHDVQAIYAFVRDEIAGEPYRGSLRGARGALWSKAANPVDRSSLLLALLGASGVTSARYARGTLSSADLMALLQGMFPPPSRAVGCVPQGTFLYSPEFDGELQNALIDHVWVELDQGPGFVAADASFPTAQIGDVFAVKASDFTDLPDDLAHRVRVEIVAETFSQAAAAFALNGGLGETVVLDRTFRAASLGGRPLSVGQFVDSSSFGGGAFSSTTHTYTPWLLVGQGDAVIANDPILVGTPFQETLTSFPLGSQLVTGMFLEIELIDPLGQVRRFERTLYDRIGFAVRETGGSIAVPPAATPAPVLNDFDVTTVHVLPGRVSLEAFVGQRDRVAAAQQDVGTLEPLLDTVTPGGPYTPEQIALLQEASEASRYLAIANNETAALGFAATADAATAQLALGYLVKAFPSTPRLTVAVTRKEGDDAYVELDVLKNDLRVTPLTGQNPDVSFWFSVAHGLVEASIEGAVLSATTGQPAVSILEILQALQVAGDLAVITGRTLDLLDPLPISDEAKARIRAATSADRIVITPTRMVTVGTTTTVGWLEVDANGHVTSVFENGGHQAIASYAGALEFSAEFNEPFAKFIGLVSGFGQVGFLYAAAVVDTIASGGGLDHTVKVTKESIEAMVGSNPALSRALAELLAFAAKFSEDGAGASLLTAMASGLIEGIELADQLIRRNLPKDPPAFPFLSSDLAPDVPPIAPGAAPGVAVDVVLDSFFTVPFDGAEVPTAYEMRVTNLGPATERFNIAAPSIPGFLVRPSLAVIQVDPGETGEVGICLTPTPPLGTIGAPVTFDATATSAANPAVTDSDGEDFTYPAFEGLALSLSPDDATTNAGVPVQTRLALRATGTAGGPVDLTLALPPGVTIQGFGTPVDLAPGQLLTQDWLLTPDATVPVDTDIVVPVRAELGPGGARQIVDGRITLRVVDPGAQCAGEASTAAREVGRTTLAEVLLQVAAVMSDLAADPSDEVARQALLGSLQTAVDQMNIPSLASAATTLDGLRTSLAAAAPGAIPGLLSSLNLALCDVESVFAEASGGRFSLLLFPPSQPLTPLGSAQLQVALSNESPMRRTFALEVGPLPAGVTATLTTPTATLGGFESFGWIPPIFVTLTSTGGALSPFDFTVTATDVASPAATRRALGSVSVREDFVSIVDVRPTPGFVEPGNPVSVRTRIYNAVNVPRSVFVSASLRNAAGAIVQLMGVVGQVELDSLAGITELDFGLTPTASLADGPYTIEVEASTSFGGAPIPGATGEGSLFLGAPLAAFLSVVPGTLPAGDGVVQTSLHVDRDAHVIPTATLVGAVQTPGEAKEIALHQDLAYVCGDTSVSIVDVADPSTPVLLDTFFDGPAELGADFNSVGCRVVDGRLVVGFDKGGSPPPPTRLAVFDLGDPLAPALVSDTSFNRKIGGGLRFTIGDFGFMTTSQISFNPFSGFIFQQNGDLLSFDLGDITAPTLAGNLFPSGDPVLGGPNMIFGAVSVPGDLALVTTTTATGDGFGTGPGDARILAIDLSTPATPTTVGTLEIPEPVLVQGIAVDGDLALASGDTLGFDTAFSGFVGNVTLSTIDVSDPTSPASIATSVTTLEARDGTVAAALGSSIFAIGGATLGADNVLLMVDASDPGSLQIVPFDVPAPITSLTRVGSQLYATSSAGIAIYDIGSLPGPVLTARVEVPKSSGVALVPGSFNLAPTEIVSGASSDVYVWEQPTIDTITWSQTVDGLAPGEVRNVALGGTLEFVLPTLGDGAIDLAPVAVVGEQIVGIAPALQQVDLPATATYTVTLRNPAATEVVYDVGVVALPAEWVQIAPQVAVPAQGSVDLPLLVTPDLAAHVDETYDFFVDVSGGGVSGSGGARLVIRTGAFLGGNPNGAIYAHAASLSSAEIAAGRATPARVAIDAINLGNREDFYEAFLALPPGWQSTRAPSSSLFVEPGEGNDRRFELTITPPSSAPAGPVDVPISVVSFQSGNEVALTLRVNVAAQGVQVDLSPNPGSPTSPFSFLVRNVGSETDTFDVSVGGAFAAIATLDASAVTLSPGEQHVFEITLGDVSLALAGSSVLVATATSRTEPAVSRSATTLVAIAASAGLDAAVAPAGQTLPAPGAAVAVLEIENLGNAEEEVEAEIVSMSGPITAALRDLDGQPAQAVSGLLVLALGGAQVPLDAELTAPGSGTVTLRVTSLRDPARTVETTATMRTEDVEPTPTPSASPVATPTPTPGPSTTPTVQPTPTASGSPGEGATLKCYRVRVKTGTPQLTPIEGLSIEDDLETTLSDVVHEVQLCNPVTVDGAAPPDPETHLACYSLRRQPGQPSQALPLLAIQNRFGEQTLRVVSPTGPTALCVPGEAHLEGAPEGEANLDDDRLRCRNVQPLSPRRLSPTPEVLVHDEFEEKRMRVRALRQLCLPASVDGSEVDDPSGALACYELQQVPGQPAFKPPGTVLSTNDLASQIVIVRNAQRRLCVPTTLLDDH